MLTVAALESKTGSWTTVAYDGGSLEPHARAGDVDAYIVATEDGLSPLGSNLRFLSEDLGIPMAEMKRLADWNRFKNPRVSLVAVTSRRPESCLRGVILAASETSECYKRFATSSFGQPYRDFYYNVSYEAIAYSVSHWRSRRLAISHLSASGRFHEDIATCNAEALAHYCDDHPNAIDSFLFIGCCITPHHLTGIARLNADVHSEVHRAITAEVFDRDGHAVIDLKWGGGS
jgi:hypothetical protein